MSLNQLKKILAILGLGAIAILLVWAFYSERQLPKKQQQDPPGRVSVQQGRTVITLDRATQIRSGITVALLKHISHREELRAYGTVVELQGLADLRRNLIDLRRNLVEARNNDAAARARVEKTKVSLDASRKEYERLKALYEDNRNISDKALQAGEVAWRSDEANLSATQEAWQAAQKSIRSAEEALQAMEDAARQQWGDVLARWLYGAPPAFERLLRHQDILIQITLPSGIPISSAPETASVQTPLGTLAPVLLISPAARTDPRIQGISFYYLASAHETQLLPGMNVPAYLPVGKEVQGILVPASAIVWWQGKAWVYVQKNEAQFIRREISTGAPVPEGWFMEKGFRRGEKVVITGAQLLLSEESLAQTQAGGEPEKE
jgi:hypothetical protein